MRVTKKQAGTGQRLIYLLASVAVSAFSAGAWAEDVAAPVANEATADYLVSDQIEAAAGKPYLKESPYTKRNQAIENQQRLPEVKRHAPMRFSSGGALPKPPSFDAMGVLGEDSHAEDNSGVVVSPAMPVDSMVTTAAPVTLPGQVDDTPVESTLAVPESPAVIDESVSMPVLAEPATPPVDISVQKQAAEPAAVIVPTPAAKEVKPSSFVDEVMSFFGGTDDEPVAPTAAPVAAPQLPSPAVESRPAVVRSLQPAKPLGAPVKTIIIEKAPTGEHSSLEMQRTRDIVTPPEIRNLVEQSDAAPIPPLILTQERFKENLAMPAEAPSSAMAAINEEIESPQPSSAPIPQTIAEAPSSVPVAEELPAELPSPTVTEPEEVAETIEVPEGPVSTVEEEVAVAPVPAQPQPSLLSRMEDELEAAPPAAVAMAPTPASAETMPVAAVSPSTSPETVQSTLQKALAMMDRGIQSGQPSAPKMAASAMPPVMRHSATTPLQRQPVVRHVAEMTETPPVSSNPPVIERETAAALPEAELAPAAAPAAAPKPTLPMKNVVIMQKLDGIKQAVPDEVQLSENTAAGVVVEEAKKVEISDDSKMMLRNFPSDINDPQLGNGEKEVKIERATVPDLELAKPEIKKHEALGISIEVQKPNLDVNDYLTTAYNAVQSGNYAMAAEYYHAILNSYPANRDALLGLATVSHRLGDIDKARELYRQILVQSPRDTDVLNNFLVLVSEEAPEKALSEMLDLEAKNPYYDVLPAQIATIYANQGNLEAAIGKMARAIQLNPEQLLYRYNLAVMLDHAGQKQQAIQAYTMVKQEVEKGGELPMDLSHIQERLTFLLSNQS